MKNPYTILGVSQDATNQDIIRAVAMAMRKREDSSTREIGRSANNFVKASTRLAADFTLPIFPARKKITPIEPTVQVSGLTVEKLNPNKYDSL